MRDRDERDVVVPTGPRSASEVVQAERVFEFAVVLLDAPAQLGQRDEAHGRGDMPYPPDYPKMPGEPKRVQPSRDRDRKRDA